MAEKKHPRSFSVVVAYLLLSIVMDKASVKSAPASEYSASAPQPEVCSRAHAPVNATKGVNRVSKDTWDPLYKLELSATRDHEYRVSVKLGSRLLPFSDAVLSLETNGSCGVGELIHDSSDFFQAEQPRSDCPLLLTTNRKSVMHNLPPLRWKAPHCGCVHFRAMIVEASAIYYVDEAKVVSGSLASTVCINATGQQHKLSHEERRELLCRVTARFSGLEIVQRPEFLQRRRLDPRYIDLAKMELALATRRSDIGLCCVKVGEERSECFRDVRRGRVDNFCEDGSPDIPFTAVRSRFMRDREEACCWRLGESRYSCFEIQSETKFGEWSADFSLDETNPLNDLADYPEEIRQLEKEYGTVLFHSDNPTTSAQTTTTSIATTTTTPTTTTPPTARRDEPVSREVTKATEEHPQRGSARQQSGGASTTDDTLLAEIAEAPEAEREGSTTGGNIRQTPEVSPTQGRSDTSMVLVSSSEIFGQQNAGGTSAERTIYKLKKQMLKLSLKAQCCQHGVAAAGSAYGDFSAVWQQCSHSASKHLQQLQHGQRICETQFQLCCMEAAVSSHLEVATWKPEQASSREWDRDRHLVNTAYMPPYFRASSPDKETPGPPGPEPAAASVVGGGGGAAGKVPDVQTSAERHPAVASSAERRKAAALLRSSQMTTASVVDEPEIDETPQARMSPKSKRPSSKEGRLKQASSKERLPARQEEKTEDPKEANKIEEEEQERLYQLGSRQAKKTSRERTYGDTSRRTERKTGRRHTDLNEAEQKQAARLRFVDEPEIPEEPELKRTSRRGKPEPISRGRHPARTGDRLNAQGAGATEAEDRKNISSELSGGTKELAETHPPRRDQGGEVTRKEVQTARQDESRSPKDMKPLKTSTTVFVENFQTNNSRVTHGTVSNENDRAHQSKGRAMADKTGDEEEDSDDNHDDDKIDTEQGAREAEETIKQAEDGIDYSSPDDPVVDEPEIPEELEQERTSKRGKPEPVSHKRHPARTGGRPNVQGVGATEAEETKNSSSELPGGMKEQAETHPPRRDQGGKMTSKEVQAARRDESRSPKDIKPLKKSTTVVVESFQTNNSPVAHRTVSNENDRAHQNKGRAKADTTGYEEEDNDDNQDDDKINTEQGTREAEETAKQAEEGIDYSSPDDPVVEESAEEEEVVNNPGDDNNADDDDGRNVEDDGQTASETSQNQPGPQDRPTTRGRAAQIPSSPEKAAPLTKHLEARWRKGFQSLENSRGVHSGGVSRTRRRPNNSGARRKKPRNNVESARHMRGRYTRLDEALEED